MLEVFLLTIVLVALAVLGLGVQVFFSKKKKFPETRVGHNKEMQKKKIYCFQTQQKRIDKGLEGDCCT